ncbi:MAG: iron uptake protein [Cellvibrio sp.]|uniref:iron uptake protein n=1 Tax=Cellvibrio sp. TaxID=1965322 RepID=UPI00319ED221
MATASPTLSTRHIVGRIGAAILGGYAFVWGAIALLHASLYALGMPFHDAEHLSSIIGFLLYLTVFLWAFAAQNMTKVWLIFVGGGLVMTASASLIQHLLL